MFPELGDVECPLLGLNNHTISEGQPPKKTSEICQVKVKYVTPSGGKPIPHSNIGDISGNYEQISTKFSRICLLTKVISTR